MLFVVLNADKNLLDKRVLVDELFEKYGVWAYFVSLAQVAQGVVKKDDEGWLWYGKYEIFLVYYRIGYMPQHYDE